MHHHKQTKNNPWDNHETTMRPWDNHETSVSSWDTCLMVVSWSHGCLMVVSLSHGCLMAYLEYNNGDCLSTNFSDISRRQLALLWLMKSFVSPLSHHMWFVSWWDICLMDVSPWVWWDICLMVNNHETTMRQNCVRRQNLESRSVVRKRDVKTIFSPWPNICWSMA
jgi:hypothetical protein